MPGNSGVVMPPIESNLGPFQANALLEEEAGNVDAARKLFQRGVKADPRALHVWQVCVWR
jgi:hypothetical protein